MTIDSFIYKCPICDQNFEKGQSLIRHIGFKHRRIIKCHALVYLYEKLSGESVIELYTKVGMSANEISKKIRHKYDWMNCNKGTILKFLKQNNIERRSTVIAMECYYERNPIWNKGLTKEDHPGIMRRSQYWTENNPSRRHTIEERQKSNYRNKLKQNNDTKLLEYEHYLSSLKTYDWFSNDKNYEKYLEHHDAAKDKHQEAVRNGLKKYYEKYTSIGQTPPTFCVTISKPEKMIKDALTSLNIDFKHQFFINRTPYDFLITSNNTIIEFNGDYWHGHESIFPDENVLHPNKNNMTIKEVREYDKAKNLKANQHGYKVITIWEHEFSTLDEAIKVVKQHLNLS